jgi:hypothetical protein
MASRLSLECLSVQYELISDLHWAEANNLQSLPVLAKLSKIMVEALKEAKEKSEPLLDHFRLILAQNNEAFPNERIEIGRAAFWVHNEANKNSFYVHFPPGSVKIILSLTNSLNGDVKYLFGQIEILSP